MGRLPRARYTLEHKLEAVRLVKGGQSLAAVSNHGFQVQFFHERASAVLVEVGNNVAATAALREQGAFEPRRVKISAVPAPSNGTAH